MFSILLLIFKKNHVDRFRKIYHGILMFLAFFTILRENIIESYAISKTVTSTPS
jgi:hypothetical protein